MGHVYTPALTSPLPRPPTHLWLRSGRALVATVEGGHQSKTSPSRVPPASREEGREVELWPSSPSHAIRLLLQAERERTCAPPQIHVYLMYYRPHFQHFMQVLG